VARAGAARLPTHTSPEGLASPCTGAAAATQATPSRLGTPRAPVLHGQRLPTAPPPQDGSVWVATHDQDADQDAAVTSNGTVDIAYRQFDSSRGRQENAIAYVVSTDGGRSFSKPAIAKIPGTEKPSATTYNTPDPSGVPSASARADLPQHPERRRLVRTDAARSHRARTSSSPTSTPTAPCCTPSGTKPQRPRHTASSTRRATTRSPRCRGVRGRHARPGNLRCVLAGRWRDLVSNEAREHPPDAQLRDARRPPGPVPRRRRLRLVRRPVGLQRLDGCPPGGRRRRPPLRRWGGLRRPAVPHEDASHLWSSDTCPPPVGCTRTSSGPPRPVDRCPRHRAVPADLGTVATQRRFLHHAHGMPCATGTNLR